MSPASKESLPLKVVESHPPERGARPTQPVILYSCCCCCCCCLHTLGGVIGAAVAGAKTNYLADDDDKFASAIRHYSDIVEDNTNYRADASDSPGMDVPTSPRSHLPSSQGLYWFSVLAVIVLSWILVFLLTGGNLLESLYMIGIGLVLIGPAWLLGGSVVMAIRLLINAKLRQDGRYWRSLRLITLGGVGGTVAGLLVMFLIFVAMNAR